MNFETSLKSFLVLFHSVLTVAGWGGENKGEMVQELNSQFQLPNRLHFWSVNKFVEQLERIQAMSLSDCAACLSSGPVKPFRELKMAASLLLLGCESRAYRGPGITNHFL